LGGGRLHLFRPQTSANAQNPYVESFNARVRDEVLDVELFDTLAEARLILADWHAAYNAEHPHSALGMVAPARFATRWREQHTERPCERRATPRSPRPTGSLREASAADATVRPDTDQPLSSGVDR